MAYPNQLSRESQLYQGNPAGWSADRFLTILGVSVQDHTQIEVQVPGKENDLLRLLSRILAVFKNS